MDNWKVGIVPLPLFLLAGGLIAPRLPWRQTAERYRGDGGHPGSFGFACGEFGKRTPGAGNRCGGDLRHLYSFRVHYGLLPDVVIESTTKFYKSTDILYLYICCIIVGAS